VLSRAAVTHKVEFTTAPYTLNVIHAAVYYPFAAPSLNLCLDLQFHAFEQLTTLIRPNNDYDEPALGLLWLAANEDA
jgi:hypothetical protein